MEYFDESLILLKRELCWDLDDIAYFKFNQRAQEYKQTMITNEEKVGKLLLPMGLFQNVMIFFVVPPKVCISIVFSFSSGDFKPQEKLKTMLVQNLEGQQRV